MNQHGMQLLTSYAGSPANTTSHSELQVRDLPTGSTSSGRNNSHTRDNGGSDGHVSRRLLHAIHAIKTTNAITTLMNSTQPRRTQESSYGPPHTPPRWLLNNPHAFHNRLVRGQLIDIHRNTTAMQAFQSSIQSQLDRIDASTASADGEVVDALEHFFWGLQGGVAMELGALDGTPNTHSMTHEYEKAMGWRRLAVPILFNPSLILIHTELLPNST